MSPRPPNTYIRSFITVDVWKSRYEGGDPKLRGKKGLKWWAWLPFERSYVWMRLHCMLDRSRQWTSHENWSITSSKPANCEANEKQISVIRTRKARWIFTMNILDPTMHAEWPSRAPGKLPLTLGVSHSKDFVSKQNKISQTCGCLSRIVIHESIQ